MPKTLLRRQDIVRDWYDVARCGTIVERIWVNKPGLEECAFDPIDCPWQKKTNRRNLKKNIPNSVERTKNDSEKNSKVHNSRAIGWASKSIET